MTSALRGGGRLKKCFVFCGKTIKRAWKKGKWKRSVSCMDGPKGPGNPAGRGCLLKDDIITCGEVCGGITMHAVTALQSTALSFSSGTCIAALLSEPNGMRWTAVHLSSCSPRAADGSFYDTSSSSLPRQGIQSYGIICLSKQALFC